MLAAGAARLPSRRDRGDGPRSANVTVRAPRRRVRRTAMNVEQARFNMIEQQIRPWDVLDQSVLSLLSVV